MDRWALARTRDEVVRYLSNLSVPESILQPYIVKKTEAVPPQEPETTENTITTLTEEPMELDVSPATSTSSTTTENATIAADIAEDGDSLQSVVIGSEPWHNQLPAVSFLWCGFVCVIYECVLGMGANYCKGSAEAETSKYTTTVQ